MTIVDEIRKISSLETLNEDQPCTAAEVSAAICTLLAEIVLNDEKQSAILAEWEDQIRATRCRVVGDHSWVYDHCGYWGHIYCICCLKHKYPELGKLRCREAIEKIGDISEEQYTERLSDANRS